jgi:ribosomal 30S subunit maturation factor RimM
VKTVGRITKTYGYEGAVVVRMQGGITGEPKQGEPVFVVTDGIPVPFFVREAYCPAPDTLIVSFDNYLTAESVVSLKGCEIIIPGEKEEDDELQELAGYILTDTVSGFSGRVIAVISNPGQMLAEVASPAGVILVPLHPDLIIAVDRRRRIIEMSLPEGLTSLND